MVRLEEFGYLLEEYNYAIENDQVKEISYSLYNEKHKETIAVGVYKKDGHCKRSIVLWPKNGALDEDKGVINEDIDSMRLDLDLADEKFAFDDITVYSYDNVNRKDLESYYVIDPKFPNNELCIDKANIAVYNKRYGMFKIYPRTENGADYTKLVESIRVTKFGIISDGAGIVYTIDNRGTVRIYNYEKVHSFIDALETKTTGVSIPNSLFQVKYDNDNMVESVVDTKCYPTKLFSRSEVEEIITKKEGKIGENKDSIYPTMLTQNYQNLKYDFMKLWTHDKMKKGKDGKITYFERKIYVVRKPESVLHKLRSNQTSLYINY